MTIASSTHRVRPAGRRYERTEKSGRSFSSESCATRLNKSLAGANRPGASARVGSL
jgi:hypothetical protein